MGGIAMPLTEDLVKAQLRFGEWLRDGDPKAPESRRAD
jgi:hypothetical protein